MFNNIFNIEKKITNPNKILFISPPFGNYFTFLPNTIPIRGSFTLKERKGKWMQILKTLRYIPLLNGWVNKIGLRNPGIDYAIRTYKKGEIISIAIMEKKDIKLISEKIPDDMDIELNVSCPNTDKHLINSGLKLFLNEKRKWCIIKLPPIYFKNELDRFYKEGFRQFHISNTLPVKYGGLSGPSLIPYNVENIKYIRSFYKDSIIIAGGGIRHIKNINLYEELGANHFSVSSICFNPILFANLYYEFCKKITLKS